MALGATTVCQRLAAAVVGGYGLAVGVSTCLSLVMPTSRDDAVLTGLLASFLVYAAVILWVFATSSLSRIWWGLGSMTATFAGLSVMLSVAVP
tara:strand:+ start:3213 stop:3491 length:279 start_codon:yes stop_codon:yes gene_type:complete